MGRAARFQHAVSRLLKTQLTALLCRVTLLTCLAFQGAGCSKGPPKPPMAPVNGKVTYKGQPIPGAIVTFAPTTADGRRSGTGTCNADGTFVISSIDFSDGVQPGEFKVTITPAPPSGDSKTGPAKSTIPEKYLTKETTPLSEKIDAAKKVEYDLKD